ncbi:MAG: carbon dioxide concentrating mechanism protein CcmL [Planctomycetes bacterium]|nr:carbon dioxide concentrating mechanism protein CcmL [Planctomycetota bacterium]
MRIAEVIGTVTLSHCLPEFEGATLRLARPLSLLDIQGETASVDTEPLVVYDPLGANINTRIALSEGGEAAQPFRPELKPVDAYNAAILDQISL